MRANLSVSSIAMAFAIISSGSSARAQQSGNSQTIIQADEETRRNSTATIEQDGSENKADGTFRGRESVTLFNGETVDLAPNGAGIYQDGSGSTATSSLRLSCSTASTWRRLRCHLLVWMFIFGAVGGWRLALPFSKKF